MHVNAILAAQQKRSEVFRLSTASANCSAVHFATNSWRLMGSNVGYRTLACNRRFFAESSSRVSDLDQASLLKVPNT